MKQRASYIVAGAGFLGAVLFLSGGGSRPERELVAQQAAQKQTDKAAAQDTQDPSKQAVLANVRTFTEAFNRHDVPTLLKLFADDCVLTEHDGTTIRGLKELEEELKDSF